MLQAGDLVKMCDVAEHVAAKEHETTVKQLLSDERQRVYIPLYQSHLPKLDEAGIIDYDKPAASCGRASASSSSDGTSIPPLWRRTTRRRMRPVRAPTTGSVLLSASASAFSSRLRWGYSSFPG